MSTMTGGWSAGSPMAAEWRRGWQFVLLTAVALLCSPATMPVYTIGVLTVPLQESFGWGRGTIQAAILFSTGLGMIGGPLCGWMIGRLGVRTAVIIGVSGVSTAVGLCSLMTGHIWQLYMLYGLMALTGAGAGAVSWTYLIASRFSASRGLALGIALSGTGLAAMLLPRIASAGLNWGDWRTSYVMLCSIGFLIVLPLALLLLPRGERTHAGQRDACAEAPGMTLAQAIRSRYFWLIGLATLCIYFSVGGLIPNIVPAMTDAGLSAAEAVSIMGFFGLAIVIGRIMVGLLIDRFWAPAIAACVLVPAGLACFAFQLPLSFAAFAAAATVVGMATGMEFDLLGFLTARHFGLGHFARIYGRLYAFVALGAGTAPPAFGYAFDVTGSYAVPLTLSACLMITGALCLLALGRYPVIGGDPPLSVNG